MCETYALPAVEWNQDQSDKINKGKTTYTVYIMMTAYCSIKDTSQRDVAIVQAYRYFRHEQALALERLPSQLQTKIKPLVAE